MTATTTTMMGKKRKGTDTAPYDKEHGKKRPRDVDDDVSWAVGNSIKSTYILVLISY